MSEIISKRARAFLSFRAVLPAVLSITIAGASTLSAAAKECCVEGQEGRVESAVEIKREFDDFIDRGRKLHESFDILIAQTKSLKGRASQLHTVPTNVTPVKLKGRELQEATRQFQIDVSQFKKNADTYRAHLEDFRRQIGECAAAQDAYNEAQKKYEMHCQQYHIPNIPPPHICLELNVSASEAGGIAQQLMSDQMRAIRAEHELRSTNAQVRDLENASAKVDGYLQKQALRLKKEQELAAEFGKLREEYDLLEIERQAIESSRTASKPAAGTVARPTVKGKIKGKN